MNLSNRQLSSIRALKHPFEEVVFNAHPMLYCLIDEV